MNEQIVKAEAAQAFTGVVIKSNGHRDGTTITLNGKEIKDLSSLSFNFWNDAYGSPVSLRWSTQEKNVQPGQISSFVTYSLLPPVQATAQATASTEAVADVYEIRQVPNTFVDVFPREVLAQRKELYKSM